MVACTISYYINNTHTISNNNPSLKIYIYELGQQRICVSCRTTIMYKVIHIYIHNNTRWYRVLRRCWTQFTHRFISSIIGRDYLFPNSHQNSKNIYALHWQGIEMPNDNNVLFHLLSWSPRHHDVSQTHFSWCAYTCASILRFRFVCILLGEVRPP